MRGLGDKIAFWALSRELYSLKPCVKHQKSSQPKYFQKYDDSVEEKMCSLTGFERKKVRGK